DPYGIKPLYYASDGGTLRFASSVKALAAGGAVPPAFDAAGLVGFLLSGPVPPPRTLPSRGRAPAPGHRLVVEEGEISAPRPVPRPAENGALAVEAAIEDSVAAHLVSDVPVAVFLSAGLDSSLVLALARRALGEAPVALTLRFDALAGTPE